MPSLTSMEFYHNFSALGLNLPQRAGIYGPNQAAKAPVILGYLLFALGKLKAKGTQPITVAELFCADAYYSFVASRFGADRCHAFDSDRDGHLAEARYLRGVLNDDRVEIHESKVADIPTEFRASVVINAGGLYHVEEPLRYLEQSYAMANQYLIVQSVITTHTEEADYFQTPAPGWKWGCRFTYGYLQKEIIRRGYKVVDSERNLLLGNHRPEDRGSAYFLIEK